MRTLAAVLLLTVWILPSLAVEPDEILKDPALEARARALSAEVRCMVCQNQSIDDSDAPLAKDLRVLVRERIEAGDTNDEVLDFLVRRYGEFVLLKPQFSLSNAVLWATPVAIFLLGSGIAILSFRRRKADNNAEPPLSEAEHEALKKILSADG